MQALKLLKKISEVDPAYIPASLVHSVVAIAQEPKDKFYRICLETLREIMVVNTRVAAECDGISTLLNAVLNVSAGEKEYQLISDLTESVIVSLIHVIDNPAARKYIRPDLDLELILSGFTNTELPPDKERLALWKVCSSAMLTMMRSWTGILFLSSDPHGLPALIQFLAQPVDIASRKHVIKTLYDILEIEFPADFLLTYERELDTVPSYTSKYYYSQGAATVLGAPPVEIQPGSNIDVDDRTFKSGAFVGHNLVHNYIAIVISSLLQNGLVEVLSKLSTEADAALSRSAVILMREFIRLCGAFLSPHEVARRLNLSTIVSEAAAQAFLKSSDVKSKGLRSMDILNTLPKVSMLVSSVHRSSTTADFNTDCELRTTIEDTYAMHRQFFGKLSNPFTYEWHQRAWKSCIEYHDDDTIIPTALKQTGVLLGKDWTKWSFPDIQNFLDTSMQLPGVFNEVFKGKFMRRLGGFFRCDTTEKGASLAGLPWQCSYMRYVKVMLSWLQLIMQSDEGLSFLMSDRRGLVVFEMADCLKLECAPESSDPKIANNPNPLRLFHPRKFPYSMVREYFVIFKFLSSSANGISLLMSAKIFEIIHDLAKIPGRDALCRLVLINFNYQECSQARALLSHWLEICTPSLKLYIISHLREILMSGATVFSSWGVDLVVHQLGSTDKAVAKAALLLLEECSLVVENLKAITHHLSTPAKDALLSSQFILMRLSSVPSVVPLIEAALVSQVGKWTKGEKNLSLKYAINQDLNLFTGLYRKTSVTETFLSQTGVKVDPCPIGLPSPPNSTVSSSLEWLMRLPWIIELQIQDGDTNVSSVLHIDTMVDSSRVSNPWTGRSPSTVRITGNVVNERKETVPLPISSNSTVKVCLMLCNQAIDKDGAIRSCEGIAHTDIGLKATQNRSLASFTTNEDDWSKCEPTQFIKAIETGNYSFVIPGDRVEWSFQEPEKGFEGPPPCLLKSVSYIISFKDDCEVVVPSQPHLFGELASTEPGCELLKSNVDIAAVYAAAVGSSSSSNVERRAALWSLGNICVSPTGYNLVHSMNGDYDVVRDILRLCRECPWPSLRGTAVQVLGLLTRCNVARSKILAASWIIPLRDTPSVASPQKADQFFTFQFPVGSNVGIVKSASEEENPTAGLTPPLPPLKPEWKEVLKNIGCLYNSIQQTEGHGKLLQLKKTSPHLFDSVELFLYLHETVLAKYKIQFKIRKFLTTNLFSEIPFNTKDYLWDVLDGVAVSIPDTSTPIADTEGTEGIATV
jgi:hypothetical protein